MRRIVVAGLIAGLAAILVPTASAKTRHVLRVGTFKNAPGQFKSIQAAINAAKPGDWVLVGPGDYKTTSSHEPPGRDNTPGAILITKANLRLRGMNRNSVVIDGTKPGSAKCSRKLAAQNFGPSSKDGPLGLNGVLIWKARNVWVQNMTACNFMGGHGHAGNGFWWNGGDDSAKIGGWGYLGTYLNATSTFLKDESTAAQYGIFSSNWNGGTWDQTYASNFNDSGYYIGACQQECNQFVNHAHAQYNALGYSGSNSGGTLVVKNSEFDNNKDGFDTNSQNGDNPPPQNGACPNNAISPITHTHSCWVFMNNKVHDNNNPNVPFAGSAGAGPVGTGVSVSGGRNDTLMNNRFYNNKAWGVILVPYLDSGPPCTGGSTTTIPGSCLYDEWGDALINNKFSNNGGYGNPTNGDFDQLNFTNSPTDCYHGNTNPKGLSPDAASLQTKYPACTGKNVPPNTNINFLNEVLCDSQVSLPPFGCQSGDHYPRRQKVNLPALPHNLKSMPNACAGVPSNPWCGGQVTKVGGCAPSKVGLKLSLDPGESFKSVTVSMPGQSSTQAAHGRSTTAHFSLASFHKKRVRVRFTENIKVGSHAEKVSFTRVYHRC